MDPLDTRTRTRRRHEQRLGLLRRRAVLGSALGFAAFVGLAAQHAVGSAKHTPNTGRSRPISAAPATYFDQQAAGFAFDDSSVAAPPPPPVAQTNVS
jgi:hypothetical protein